MNALARRVFVVVQYQPNARSRIENGASLFQFYLDTNRDAVRMRALAY